MTHADIIDLWPSLSEFADDLAIPYGTAKAMRRRSSIPVEYWSQLTAKACEKGLSGATLGALADAASLRRDSTRIRLCQDEVTQ